METSASGDGVTDKQPVLFLDLWENRDITTSSCTLNWKLPGRYCQMFEQALVEVLVVLDVLCAFYERYNVSKNFHVGETRVFTWAASFATYFHRRPQFLGK